MLQSKHCATLDERLTNSGGLSTPVELVEIHPDRAEQRIDNFLLGRVAGVPKSHVYRLLRTGQVRVNGGRVRPAYRLQAGDRVRIPPIRSAPKSSPRVSPALADSLEQRILFEDEGVIVVDKPAGLAVHGGSGLAVNLIDAMRCQRPGPPVVELVHRLDRETSGCLLIAKHRKALGLLHKQLQLGLVHKHYLTLLAGVWGGGTRSVRAPLARNRPRGGERETRVDSEGREAVTHFCLQTQFAQACLVEARIETGRTHQIRVHAAHAGHPVAGDNKYGNAPFNRLMKTAGLKRLFLHASRLEFDRDGRIAITAPLPQELQAVLQDLGPS